MKAQVAELAQAILLGLWAEENGGEWPPHLQGGQIALLKKLAENRERELAAEIIRRYGHPWEVEKLKRLEEGL